jgi:hypothetical protein
MTATKKAFQAALDKASAMGGTRNIVSVDSYRGTTRYTVRGSVAPRTYIVTDWPDGELHCSCPAGFYDAPCWHSACCYLLRAAQASQRIIAPRVASDSTVPPSSRAEALGVRRPMIDDGPNCQELVFGMGR